MEIAGAFGIQVSPDVADTAEMDAAVDFDPHRARRFTTLIEAWLPLTYAVNSLNRSMGQPDLYPFLLSPPAIAKLEAIHGFVHAPR